MMDTLSLIRRRTLSAEDDMTTESSKVEAKRIGYMEYANVNYENMARSIRDRLNAENPKHDASIGLMPDDSWTVWYRNLHISK